MSVVCAIISTASPDTKLLYVEHEIIPMILDFIDDSLTEKWKLKLLKAIDDILIINSECNVLDNFIDNDGPEIITDLYDSATSNYLKDMITHLKETYFNDE